MNSMNVNIRHTHPLREIVQSPASSPLSGQSMKENKDLTDVSFGPN